MRELILAFSSPTRLGQSLVLAPRWKGAFALSVLLCVASALPSTLSERGRELQRQAMAEAMAKFQREHPLPPGTPRAEPRLPSPMFRIVFIAVEMPLFILFGAFLLMFLFDNLLNWGPAEYRVYLSIQAHTMLITGVGWIATAIVGLIVDDVTFSPSLAWLLGDQMAIGVSTTLAKSVELFSVWSLVASALTIAAARKRPKLRAIVILLAAYFGAFALLSVLGKCGGV